jgi:hypothetical protein
MFSRCRCKIIFDAVKEKTHTYALAVERTKLQGDKEKTIQSETQSW